MPRARIPLTLGAGLDRSTGAGVRDARTLADSRNLIAREAGVGLRYGLALTGLPALTWGTDLLATETVELTRDILQVVFNRVTREIRVERVNPVGQTRQVVGTWGTLNSSASFPVVTLAEQDGLVYLAHAEPLLLYRLPTMRWAPGALDTDPGTLATVTADLDGNGTPGTVYFYGVTAYRTYIVGWGWGTEGVGAGDRPEIVRLTRPDDPTVWPPESYFICGSKSARIEACVPMPGGLLARTRSAGFTIYGADPSTFGLELTDTSAGIVSPRAWAVVDGVAYVWSVTGPRVITDPMGGSRDLGIPLDLDQPMPAGLPARGPEREAFAAYEATQRVLYWAHPELTANGVTRTLVYLQSLRSDAPRFTMGILERRVASAGRWLTGKVAPPAGTGYAILTAFTDTPVVATGRRTLTATWANTAVLGNEIAEVWLKVGAGAWSLFTSRVVTGVTDTVTVPDADPLQDYAVAVRLRTPSGSYTADYDGATPDDWTASTAAAARMAVQTGAVAPTIGASASWARQSATQHGLTVTILVAHSGLQLDVERFDGNVWVPATMLTSTNRPSAVLVSTFPETSVAVGATVPMRARLSRGAIVSAWSATVNLATGVTRQVTSNDVWLLFDRSGAPPADSYAVEVWFQPPGGGFSLQFEELGYGIRVPVETDTLEGGLRVARVPVDTDAGPRTVTLRMRFGLTTAGITDYGPWASFTCPVNDGASDPPTPVLADYWAPRGDFDGPPDSPLSMMRLLSRTFTPSQLTTASRRLQFYFAIPGGPQPFRVPPFTSARQNLPTLTGGTGQLYYYAIAFHFDETTRRRSAFRSLNP